MSIAIQNSMTPGAAFESHFGAPPGTQDAKLECQRWEQLCANLLAEREKLRAELDKARLDKICAEWGPIGSMEEVYAQVDRETTLEQLIEEIEREAGDTA